MAKEIRLYNSVNDRDFDGIINQLAELAKASVSKNYPNLVESFVLNNYSEKNEEIKDIILGFASSKAGIKRPTNADEMMNASDNSVFTTWLNTITTQTIQVMMKNYENPQLNRLASVDIVQANTSKTYQIDTRALPQVQLGNYKQNVTLVPSYAMGSVTITPQVHSVGVSLDYMNLLVNGYDWGKAVAKIYASFIYAQYKEVVNLVFSKDVLEGTPLYLDTFSQDTYLQLADDIGMLNGGSANDVVALGTRVALGRLASQVASNGGSAILDEYVKEGYIGQIAGVPAIIVDNFANLSIPYTKGNAEKLRAIPNDVVVLVSRSSGDIVKIVRESYVRAEQVEAETNTLNRMEYMYHNAWGAKIITASFFGVQKVTKD